MNKGSQNIELGEDERLDDLHRNGYKIIQNTKNFCFGIDAVLLSSYAKVMQGEKTIDLGTGTGIIPILLKAKTRGSDFTALEIQEEMATMAKRSVKYNGLEDEIKIMQGDIKGISKVIGRDIFDVVTCNPPYMTFNHGKVNEDMSKAIARHEIKCTLEDVIIESKKLLKVKGRLYLIHRPFRLGEIISKLCKHNLEPKRMRLVHPFVNKEANLVLLECIKGGNSMIKVEPPLIVYEKPQVYTQEVMDIYGY